MSRVVLLVRHAECRWNVERRYLGHQDVELTEHGQGQARGLSEMLASWSYDAVWSSDLRRAVETARLAGVEPRQDARLREIDFGQIEGARWEDLTVEIQQALVQFEDFQAPGGESVARVRSRVREFLDSLPRGRHVVVTHGGVMRILLGVGRRIEPACAVELPDRESDAPSNAVPPFAVH